MSTEPSDQSKSDQNEVTKEENQEDVKVETELERKQRQMKRISRRWTNVFRKEENSAPAVTRPKGINSEESTQQRASSLQHVFTDDDEMTRKLEKMQKEMVNWKIKIDEENRIVRIIFFLDMKMIVHTEFLEVAQEICKDHLATNGKIVGDMTMVTKKDEEQQSSREEEEKEEQSSGEEEAEEGKKGCCDIFCFLFGKSP